MSLIKADQSEAFFKITARHDLTLKLHLKKNYHWKRAMYGEFVLLDHPLLLLVIPTTTNVCVCFFKLPFNADF